jgi:hypothetical protein
MQWLLELEQDFKILSNSQSIADLGPQDLTPDLKVLLTNENPLIVDARGLYSQWGIKNYTSFDLFDPRAENVDLNIDLGRTDSWDIVTNFGTSEHLFNQFAFMKNCHDLTKPGGLSLHVVPISSGMDHGLFNYHPTFFRSLAIANNYEIIDFRYIPFIVMQEKSKKEKYRYVNIGKSRELRERKNIFLSKLKLSCRIMNLPILINSEKFYQSFFLGDYAFVAFRKNSDDAFVAPIQERYL